MKLDFRIGVRLIISVIGETSRCMKTQELTSINMNFNNSYLRLFTIAQQNWQLWQEEEQRRKHKRHRTKVNELG